MARTRADIERDIARARRDANEPIYAFEERNTEREILKELEQELARYKEPEVYNHDESHSPKPEPKEHYPVGSDYFPPATSRWELEEEEQRARNRVSMGLIGRY